jgi:hypothetical protein
MNFLNQGKGNYTINGFILNGAKYQKAEAFKGTINYLKEEMGFNKYCSVYDIMIDSFTDLGYSDIYHEEFIKNIEAIFERDLTKSEILEYIEAYNDYNE